MTKAEILKKLEAFDDDDHIALDGKPYLFDVEAVCGKSDVIMGYDCVLPPGHEGRCWSNTKQVHFDENNTTFAELMDETDA